MNPKGGPMRYTVGEIAKKLNVAPLHYVIMIKKACALRRTFCWWYPCIP